MTLRAAAAAFIRAANRGLCDAWTSSANRLDAVMFDAVLVDCVVNGVVCAEVGELADVVSDVSLLGHSGLVCHPSLSVMSTTLLHVATAVAHNPADVNSVSGVLFSGVRIMVE